MTLIFLHKGDEILLAQKKRGFGEGRWNGAGGKLEPGETVTQALVRECQEEISVTPKKYHQVAQLTFEAYFNGTFDTLRVYAFLCETWEGDPAETEEMRPQWFKKSEIPYDDMWQDDKFWVPLVLDGKLAVGTFTFDEQDKMLTHDIKEVTQLPRTQNPGL